MLMMYGLPQLSGKAKKLKLVESRQFCTRGVHIEHLKTERYLLACCTGVSKFMDTITMVYRMYTKLSFF